MEVLVEVVKLAQSSPSTITGPSTLIPTTNAAVFSTTGSSRVRGEATGTSKSDTTRLFPVAIPSETLLVNSSEFNSRSIVLPAAGFTGTRDWRSSAAAVVPDPSTSSVPNNKRPRQDLNSSEEESRTERQRKSKGKRPQREAEDEFDNSDSENQDTESEAGTQSKRNSGDRIIAGDSPRLWWDDRVTLETSNPYLPRNTYWNKAKRIIHDWREALDLVTGDIHRNPCSRDGRLALESLMRRHPTALDSAATILDKRFLDPKHIILPLTMQKIKDAKNIPSHLVKDEESAEYLKLVQEWDLTVQELEKHTGAIVVKSQDGVELLWKLDQGLSQDEMADVEGAVEGLVSGWNDHFNEGLPGSTDNDKRHYLVKEAIKKYGKHDVGVFHFAFWIAAQQNPFGPVVSSEGASGSYKFKLAQEFHHQLRVLFERTAGMMRLLTPEIYAAYKSHMDLLADYHPDFKAVYGSSVSCFIGAAIVRNHRVIPHCDSKDTKNGVVCMVNTGQYKGGDLIVGTHAHQIRLVYTPGDIVMFRSSFMRHGITPFVGRRTAVVLFTHEDVATWESEKHGRTAPFPDVCSTFRELREEMGLGGI